MCAEFVLESNEGPIRPPLKLSDLSDETLHSPFAPWDLIEAEDERTEKLAEFIVVRDQLLFDSSETADSISDTTKIEIIGKVRARNAHRVTACQMSLAHICPAPSDEDRQYAAEFYGLPTGVQWADIEVAAQEYDMCRSIVVLAARQPEPTSIAEILERITRVEAHDAPPQAIPDIYGAIARIEDLDLIEPDAKDGFKLSGIFGTDYTSAQAKLDANRERIKGLRIFHDSYTNKKWRAWADQLFHSEGDPEERALLQLHEEAQAAADFLDRANQKFLQDFLRGFIDLDETASVDEVCAAYDYYKQCVARWKHHANPETYPNTARLRDIRKAFRENPPQDDLPQE